MKIFNQTKGTLLAQDVFVAATPLKRAKGLLGRKDFKKGEALIIKPCNSIHTFFMRFPIDVLFVDKESKVISAISNLAPFRLSPIYFRATYVIELPAGTIQAASTQVNDHLVLE